MRANTVQIGAPPGKRALRAADSSLVRRPARGMLCVMPPSRDHLDRLVRLRERFLAEPQPGRALPDYWRDARDLAAYDAVFGARIGWKWDAALAECRDRGLPYDGRGAVLDFGCGTGVAARAFVRHFGASEVACHDRSPAAMAFAVAALRREAPAVRARTLGDVGDARCDVLLVSHVLGELDANGEQRLRGLLARCRVVVLVEPGSRVVSRRLSALRDTLLGEFHPIAPCPHAAACPALARDDDWCHFFATPPPQVFTESDWVVTAKALGIDLRALPYSFVALARTPATAPPPPHRTLGRAELDKHSVRLQVCEPGALRRAVIEKRDDAATWRLLKKHPEALRTLPR